MKAFSTKRQIYLLLSLVISFLSLEAMAQDCPSAIINFPSDPFPYEVCIGQSLSLDNASANAVNYEWDFCEGDLHETPVASNINTISASSNPRGLVTVKDGNNWYGFMVSSGNNSIFRLSFGANLNNANPSISNLGNPGGLLSNPDPIRVVKEGSNWIALVHSGNNARIVRLNFGTSLNNSPTASIAVSNIGAQFSSMDLANSEGEWIGVLSNYSNNKLNVVNFGSSLLNNPAPEDILETDAIQGATGLIDIRLYRECDVWYGFALGMESKTFHRLKFGSSLMDQPEVQNITGSIIGTSSPYRIRVEKDKGNYIAFITTISGTLIRVNFGPNIESNFPGSDRVTLSGLANNRTFSLVKQNSSWYAFTINYLTKDFYRLTFPDNCTANISTSVQPAPSNISFSSSGTYHVNLKAIGADGRSSDVSRQLTVVNSISPTVDFTTNNHCVSNQSQFTGTSNNEGGINSWLWDFGDGNSASGKVVNHQYAQPGSYIVILEVQTTEGCPNTRSRQINIYDEPQADFAFTSGGLCTYQGITFANESDLKDAPEVTWTWDFNGEGSTNTKNGSFTFTSPGKKMVSLTANLSGCLSTEIKEIDIHGVGVNFSYTNNCFGEAVKFKNESVGANILSYEWDFGDGNGSSDEDPEHHFIEAGEYEVKLTVMTNEGCEAKLSKTIIVTDDPLADFTFEDAIENYPVKFTAVDLTSESDEVIGWNWDFGELGASNEKDPVIRFPEERTYQVKLTAETTQGCSFEVVKEIDVAKAEFPFVDFEIPEEVCIGENVKIINNSLNAVEYEWSFCGRNLASTPILENLGELESGNLPYSIEIVEENKKYFGFVASRGNNRILRLEFGTSLNDKPKVIDLGNIGGLLSNPEKLTLIKDGGKWYGLAINQSGNRLIRIEFGDFLDNNSPTATNLGTFNSLSAPRDIVVAKNNSDLIAVITNWNSNNLTLLNFGPSIMNVPQGENIKNTVSFPGISGAIRTSIIKIENVWYGLLTSYLSQKVTLLNFGDDLFSIPNVFDLPFTFANPVGVYFIEQQPSRYFAFVTEFHSGNLVRLDFGNSISINPQYQNLGTFGMLQEVVGITIDHNLFETFVIKSNSKELIKLNFEETLCLGSLETSELHEPYNLNYQQKGTFPIRLKAINSEGVIRSTIKNIIVNEATSPEINFSFANTCLNNSTTFAGLVSENQVISTWQWDFGDGSTAEGEEVQHQFAEPGTYKVKLSVESEEGCKNFIEKNVAILPEPDFQLPSGLTCSASELIFANTSMALDGVSYHWDFNGEGSSDNHTGKFFFNTGGLKTITLTSSIEGCTQSTSKQINLSEGAIVDFEFNDTCQGTELSFTNTTPGNNVVSYEWDFGDGYLSTQKDPVHQYDISGTFAVTLKAVHENGCETSKTKQIVIHALPDADFNHELACDNNVVKFEDQSSVNEANIQSWLWTFGVGAGLQNNTSDVKDPEFAFPGPGDYVVKLEVTSNYGCKNTVEKTVSVLPAPVPDFAYTEACIGSETQFTYTAPPGNHVVTNWLWEINGTTYTVKDPKHTFTGAGTFTVKLLVTYENRCMVSSVKEVTINPLSVPDFEYSLACRNKLIQFTDNSQSFGDDVISYAWEFGSWGTAVGPSASFSLNNTGNVKVTLTVKTQRGCTLKAEKNIFINPNPEADFAPDHHIGAAPYEVKFTNQTTGASSYKWVFEEGIESNETSPVYTFSSPGIYEVTLIAYSALGCDNIMTKTIDVREPALDVSVDQVRLAQVNGKSRIVLTLTNRGSVVVQNMDFVVSVSNRYGTTEKFVGKILPEETISYTLKYDIQDDFSSKSSFVCVVAMPAFTGLEETDKQDNKACYSMEEELIVVNPYPNPVSGELKIPVITPEKDNIRISIVNSYGKIIFYKEFTDTRKGLNEYTFDFSGYVGGMYLLRISFQSQEITKKLIVY